MTAESQPQERGGATVEDEWELRTDMLTGAIRLVCVRGDRHGLIYEWPNVEAFAAMHEASLQESAQLATLTAENNRLRTLLMALGIDPHD